MEMTPRTANPANTPVVYRVGRRTATQVEAAERWADSMTATYWEARDRSVHWTKLPGLAGWYVMNDAAYYVLQHVHDEECEVRELPELLDWNYEEVGQVDAASANPVPFTPAWEQVPMLPLINAMRELPGPVDD